ncbi:MAG: hypothetical protein HOJ79_05885 [Nitrospina sp.]|nr:hypothetical protein [Nitrospina sp.]
MTAIKMMTTNPATACGNFATRAGRAIKPGPQPMDPARPTNSPHPNYIGFTKRKEYHCCYFVKKLKVPRCERTHFGKAKGEWIPASSPGRTLRIAEADG